MTLWGAEVNEVPRREVKGKKIYEEVFQRKYEDGDGAQLLFTTVITFYK